MRVDITKQINTSQRVPIIETTYIQLAYGRKVTKTKTLHYVHPKHNTQFGK